MQKVMVTDVKFFTAQTAGNHKQDKQAAVNNVSPFWLQARYVAATMQRHAMDIMVDSFQLMTTDKLAVYSLCIVVLQLQFDSRQ